MYRYNTLPTLSPNYLTRVAHSVCLPVPADYGIVAYTVGHKKHTTLFTSSGSKVRINKFIQIDY